MTPMRAKDDSTTPAGSAWLIDQGAVRPMAPAGVTVLALGKFHRTAGKETGTYPVSYHRSMIGVRRAADAEETWYHHREKLKEAPTRQQCLDWILESDPEEESSF